MIDDDVALYDVVLSERAYYDFHLARIYVRATSGETAMGEWEKGFWDALETLKSMPYRAIVPESARFKRETRQITYIRKGASYSHRIIYQIQERNRLLVTVVHVRHASRDSISGQEADILQRQSEFDVPISDE
ncbi:MAG: type II toxin-antitoxin system RelE/ParE family toxin [Akkermansiaceae bacterium]|nr:type II toxin-antitoxin system RelE/ParE family toxin [Armatimonadota bacterium]